jgi:hypothetical protein
MSQSSERAVPPSRPTSFNNGSRDEDIYQPSSSARLNLQPEEIMEQPFLHSDAATASPVAEPQSIAAQIEKEHQRIPGDSPDPCFSPSANRTYEPKAPVLHSSTINAGPLGSCKKRNRTTTERDVDEASSSSPPAKRARATEAGAAPLPVVDRTPTPPDGDYPAPVSRAARSPFMPNARGLRAKSLAARVSRRRRRRQSVCGAGCRFAHALAVRYSHSSSL